MPDHAEPPAAQPIVAAPIATEHLELTPLRVADAEEMVAVLADPSLYGFIGGEPPTLDDLVARYRAQVAGPSANRRETWHNWIVRDRASGSAAGFVQATIVEDGDAGGPSAEIAWLIGTPWQGRGYATEAARALVAWLEALGARSIVAHVHPDHAASAAVADRAGLEPTDRMVEGERAWQRIVRPIG
jgi:RimJ/RimL family protein N-acetyltransferase